MTICAHSYYGVGDVLYAVQVRRREGEHDVGHPGVPADGGLEGPERARCQHLKVRHWSWRRRALPPPLGPLAGACVGQNVELLILSKSIQGVPTACGLGFWVFHCRTNSVMAD